MKVLKDISITRFAAQVLFLLLPTLLVVMFLLWHSTQYLSLLKEQWLTQSMYVGLGMALSFFTYQFRLRFLPTFALLCILLFTAHKFLDNYSFSEFDGFFISVQFQLFSILFGIGWLLGWAFERISYSSILISGLLLLLGIYLISKTGELTPYKLLIYFSPIALYAIYSIYTQNSLRLVEKSSPMFWFRYMARLILFVGFLLLVFRVVVYFLDDEIKERVEEYGGNGKEGDNDMLKRNKDGTVENKESMSLDGNNKKKNNPEPLFCAHIDSYIPGTEIPNPLYLTSYHYSKYDTLTETFERDTTNQFNDEFIPNPSQIPLFFTVKDSSKIRNAFGTKNKKTVEIEIYKKRLSPSAFLAPSTSFFVQPITIEKEFQGTFGSAYRAKSYVSDLNSAYFIYNTDEPGIKQFQEQRFSVLRKVKPYSTINQDFFNYYTQFNTKGIYKPVKRLADSLQRGKTTTIDKVLAVRDYFLHKDALGESVYRYTDNPGIPGLPGASKLLYFLFESKKGYCAYYAAATVFLLRSMNIPSRVVTGFLTVDRSDKNKGWYWFYEDQSHGWVQVYFPEYGWIDFDTTVGNDDAQQSPSPDGTPPLQPPKAVMAGRGLIEELDTIAKTATLRTTDIVFKDVEYHKLNELLKLDLHIAFIWKDSVRVSLSQLKLKDPVMVVSYAERLKALSPEKEVSQLVKKFPKEIPIDDVFIKNADDEKKENRQAEAPSRREGIWYYIKWTMFWFGVAFLLFFTIPIGVYRYFLYRMKKAKRIDEKAYYTYKSASFFLHQLGYERGSLSPLTFAKQHIDPEFKTRFASFVNLYLKQKYANQQLNEKEAVQIQLFYYSFQPFIQSKISLWKRFKLFLNVGRCLRYFGLLEEE